MKDNFLIRWLDKRYKTRLAKATIQNHDTPFFFPSGKARELMRYVKNGRSMLVLMGPAADGEFLVSAKWIDHWETETGIEPATEREKREVLAAAIQYLQEHGKKVQVIDRQSWQIE